MSDLPELDLPAGVTVAAFAGDDQAPQGDPTDDCDGAGAEAGTD